MLPTILQTRSILILKNYFSSNLLLAHPFDKNLS